MLTDPGMLVVPAHDRRSGLLVCVFFHEGRFPRVHRAVMQQKKKKLAPVLFELVQVTRNNPVC